MYLCHCLITDQINTLQKKTVLRMDNEKQKQRTEYKRRWHSADRLLKKKKDDDISDGCTSSDHDKAFHVSKNQQSLPLPKEEKKHFQGHSNHQAHGSQTFASTSVDFDASSIMQFDEIWNRVSVDYHARLF